MTTASLPKPPAAHIDDQAASKIPATLRNKLRWLVWRRHLPKGETKWKKPPVDSLSGRLAKNWRDPKTWLSFDDARKLSTELGDGIGYCLDDGEVAVDLDHCFDAAGNLKPEAKAHIEALDSYTERSPSGQGAHVIVKGKKPTAKCRVAGTEVYDSSTNYLTFTGNHLEGTPTSINARQKALDRLYAPALEEIPTGGGSRPAASLELSDDELLNKARETDVTFGPLFDQGDIGGRNPSSADVTLMNKLAFWYGRDPVRMERMFSTSALGKRAKWTDRADYRKRTIDRAIANCEKVYEPGWRPPKASENGRNEPPRKSAVSTDDDLPPVHEGPDDPHRLARIYLHSGKNGDAIVVYHQAEFHVWDGTAYRSILAHVVRAGLSKVAKCEFDRINPLEIKAWDERGRTNLWTGKPCAKPEARKVTRMLIGNMELALSGTSLVSDRVLPPVWLTANPPFPAVDVLPMRNALVHLPSFIEGKSTAIHPPTPAFYCPYALDYDFNPKAKAPENWMSFLLSVWPNEGESILALQEWMGYLLTLDTRQQKIAFLIGPPRSGRGTIARVIKRLIGPENFAGPTLSGLATPFGAQCLIGKTAAIIADARISNRSDWAVVLERLLAISGEDHIEVDRKNLPAWSGTLPTRLMVISNELPRLPDQSGALSSRLLLWRFLESFLGREDKGLESKLHAELGGILLWSIEGWKRLRERGSFLQPLSGQELIDEMRDLSSPVGAWFRERCIAETSASIDVDVAFADWESWCESRKKDKPGDVSNFGRFLRAVLPRLETKKRRGQAGEKPYIRVFHGFSLKPTGEAPY